MTTKFSLILLPPSEGKAPGGTGPAWAAGTMTVDLDEMRLEGMAALARAMRWSAAARSKLLGVKGKALAAATAADTSVASAPTMPAIERYTGVLYDALDAPSLTGAQRRRLDTSVLIFSGLWGVVSPGDPIPDYKLKMGASLPKVGKLSSWWREALTARICELAGPRPIWNLLPIEHVAAWAPPEHVPQFSVRFLERREDGSLTAVSHWNKFLKGALVRHLLANPTSTPADLTGWEHPTGFRLEPSLSRSVASTTELSFVLRA